MFDIAEAKVKCYTTDKSNLTFDITTDESHFGHIFNENIGIKSSIIRENWLKSYDKL